MAKQAVPHHTSLTTIWHPSTDRGVFMGAVGSKNRHRKGVLPTCVSGNKHTELGLGCEHFHVPLTSHSLGTPGEHNLRQPCRDKSLCGSTGFQERNSSIPWELKNEFGCTGVGKRNSMTLPISRFTQGSTAGTAQLSAKWGLTCVISHREK